MSIRGPIPVRVETSLDEEITSIIQDRQIKFQERAATGDGIAARANADEVPRGWLGDHTESSENERLSGHAD
ncbi:MAG: hypothetical protein QNL91_11270 [Candidatus Krumholzibacteria bacterium]|nr:hypothetical protein [Candidatus Krumholzibacteria bacterium]